MRDVPTGFRSGVGQVVAREGENRKSDGPLSLSGGGRSRLVRSSSGRVGQTKPGRDELPPYVPRDFDADLRTRLTLAGQHSWPSHDTPPSTEPPNTSASAKTARPPNQPPRTRLRRQTAGTRYQRHRAHGGWRAVRTRRSASPRYTRKFTDSVELLSATYPPRPRLLRREQRQYAARPDARKAVVADLGRVLPLE